MGHHQGASDFERGIFWRYYLMFWDYGCCLHDGMDIYHAVYEKGSITIFGSAIKRLQSNFPEAKEIDYVVELQGR
jgi:hypothetical protein